MTDEYQWGEPEAQPYRGRAAVAAPAVSAPAGWYPDPWSQGHHRYWDGAAWTSGAFPHGPGNPWADEGSDAAEDPSQRASGPAPASPTPPPVRAPGSATPPPPPSWTLPTYPGHDPLPAAGGWVASPGVTELASKRSRLPNGLGFVALVVGVMVLVGSIGTLGGYLIFRHHPKSVPAATGPFPTIPPFTIPAPGPTLPADPASAALVTLGLTQGDVPSTVVVQPIIGGTSVTEQPTLDLCNGDYPSESQRSARLQVGGFDGQANLLLSTEAVLYNSAAATEQAFSELKSVAANCPAGPVPSPVNGSSSATHFNAAPDGAWAQTATVIRQAYDLVTTDELGATQHSVAVYLRRGRVLLGVYFYEPDSPQVPVGGQTSIEKIVDVFATRLAQLPTSVVNG